MVRIGMVGSDNSHAIAFSKLCNVTENDLRVEGAQVVAVFGEEEARTQEVSEEGRIPKIVSRPEDMIGDVDAVLVVFRHGGKHREYAEPFVREGIPTFVDKPLAVSSEDARALLDLADAKGSLLTSFSTLRYAGDMLDFKKEMDDLGPTSSAVFSGPADRESEYGGLPFYGIHIAEMMQALYGPGVKSVSAVENGKNIVATLGYEGGRVGTLNFLGDASYVFHMLAFGKDGWAGRALDASTCYRDGLEVVLKMVESGNRPLTNEALLEPVLVLEAIESSLSSGNTVNLA
jgi:predicted dehydrogenase